MKQSIKTIQCTHKIIHLKNGGNTITNYTYVNYTILNYTYNFVQNYKCISKVYFSEYILPSGHEVVVNDLYPAVELVLTPVRECTMVFVVSW